MKKINAKCIKFDIKNHEKNMVKIDAMFFTATEEKCYLMGDESI